MWVLREVLVTGAQSALNRHHSKNSMHRDDGLLTALYAGFQESGVPVVVVRRWVIIPLPLLLPCSDYYPI